MKGVILAAGKGSRLQELTEDIPKVLLRVGDKTCLEHIITGMQGAGIEEIIIVIGYLGDKIVKCFGNGEKLGVKLSYVEQSLDRYGTGYAASLVEPFLDDDSIMLSFGDIIIDPINYRKLFKQYNNQLSKSENLAAVLSLNWVEDPSQGGAVYLKEDGLVEKIVEKPASGTSTTHWNSAGLFAFAPVFFRYLDKISRSDRGEYEITNAINLLLEDNLNVGAMQIESYWQDVGTVESYKRICKILGN